MFLKFHQDHMERLQGTAPPVSRRKVLFQFLLWLALLVVVVLLLTQFGERT